MKTLIDGVFYVENKKEFEQAYWYNGKPDKYPKRYPCIVEQHHEDGGLGGSYVHHEIFYIPKQALPYIDWFLLGFKHSRGVYGTDSI